MKKTLLITGGNGFIGRNLKEQLSDKYNIYAPTHKELDLLSCRDIKTYFKKYNIDYVINCANVGGTRKNKDPETIKKNIKMYLNLTTYGNFDQIIQLGSGAEYDKYRDLDKVSEYQFGEHIPNDDYGFSKFLISRCIGNREDSIGIRPFGVFGKYEDYEYKFISNAIVKNLMGLPITINQNTVMDWIYIDDLVKIIDGFINLPKSYRFYNITSTTSVDLLTIAKNINKLSDKPTEIIVENKGMNYNYTGNNERLMETFGNKLSFTPMETAISELIGYYKFTLPAINKDKIKTDKYNKSCIIRGSHERM